MANSTLAPTTGNVDAFNLKSIETGGVIHEDVMDKIFDISRIPLPFTDMVGKTSHKNERFDWVLDELNPPMLNNQRVDGQDAGDLVSITGGRVGNHSQISDKVIAVSYRADSSDTIGRAKELAYRLTRANQEIRRDVEAAALFNQASQAGTDAVVGITGGLPTWIETSVFNADGSEGTAGGYNYTSGLTTEATAGAAAPVSFKCIKDAIQSVYEEGGEVSVLMSTPSVITGISTYMFNETARIATLQADQGKSTDKAKALASVNVIVSDFGTVKLVPNRLQPGNGDVDATTGLVTSTSDNIFLLDPEYVSLSYLEGYRTDTLAKTGLAEKRQISVDWGLRVHTEKAHAMITGVDGSKEAVE